MAAEIGARPAATAHRPDPLSRPVPPCPDRRSSQETGTRDIAPKAAQRGMLTPLADKTVECFSFARMYTFARTVIDVGDALLQPPQTSRMRLAMPADCFRKRCHQFHVSKIVVTDQGPQIRRPWLDNRPLVLEFADQHQRDGSSEQYRGNVSPLVRFVPEECRDSICQAGMKDRIVHASRRFSGGSPADTRWARSSATEWRSSAALPRSKTVFWSQVAKARTVWSTSKTSCAWIQALSCRGRTGSLSRRSSWNSSISLFSAAATLLTPSSTLQRNPQTLFPRPAKAHLPHSGSDDLPNRSPEVPQGIVNHGKAIMQERIRIPVQRRVPPYVHPLIVSVQVDAVFQ